MTDGIFLLGIDGGGTSCRARVTDLSGTVLGEGRGGSVNSTLGVQRSYNEILATSRRAFSEAGLTEADLARTHAGFGVAGLHYERDKRDMRAIAHPFASLSIENDAYTACLGAHDGEDGAIAIFGTGSSGIAILDGVGHNVGGWGFRISDHGCGAHAGLEAVRRSLQAHEGILPSSDFTRAVMLRFDHDAEKVGVWAETAKPADYGTFAPLVVEHAGYGDSLATRIMMSSAGDAAHIILALTAKGAKRVALMGGFSKPLQPWLPDTILPFLTEPKSDAQDGALLMARKAMEAARP